MLSALLPSYLQRVKLFSVVAGAGSAAAAYHYAKTDLLDSTRDLSGALPGSVPEALRRELPAADANAEDSSLLSSSLVVFTREDRERAAVRWNRAVDAAFGKAIDALHQRGL